MRPMVLLLGVLFFTSAVTGDMIAPNPTSLRVALAPVTVVGTVTRIEEKPIQLTRYPGAAETVPFLVAVVRVDQGLVGAEGKTHLRVAFPQPVLLPPNQLQLGRPRPMPPQLVKDQEVLLFLRPHEKESVHVAADPFGFVASTGNPGYKGEVFEAVKAARLLAVPAESLRGTDRESRYLTAVLLIHRYTQGVPGKSEKVAIDAEESRLILKALAEADWKPNQPGRNFQVEPLQAFFRLGLTPADGWNRPREFKDFPGAAQKWLNDHAGTYRIRRTVPVEP